MAENRRDKVSNCAIHGPLWFHNKCMGFVEGLFFGQNACFVDGRCPVCLFRSNRWCFDALAVACDAQSEKITPHI